MKENAIYTENFLGSFPRFFLMSSITDPISPKYVWSAGMASPPHAPMSPREIKTIHTLTARAYTSPDTASREIPMSKGMVKGHL